MKVSPMAGTVRTEKAPPVTVPVPYRRSQTPGRSANWPRSRSTMVRSAPTAIGGAKLSANLRTGPLRSGMLAALDFQPVVRVPIAIASSASPSQISSQRETSACWPAYHPARIAVTPTATCPQPEKAVNDDAFSIVSRM